MVYKKWSEPGRNVGKRSESPSSSPGSGSLIEVAGPAVPSLDTERRDKPPFTAGAKTMVPSGPHVPPRPSGVGARSVAGPPARATCLSFVREKNAMWVLSGDQNG